nr:hypothetical protein JVH1_0994 [Rhodococcus sp. JVH1]
MGGECDNAVGSITRIGRTGRGSLDILPIRSNSPAGGRHSGWSLGGDPCGQEIQFAPHPCNSLREYKTEHVAHLGPSTATGLRDPLPGDRQAKVVSTIPG